MIQFSISIIKVGINHYQSNHDHYLHPRIPMQSKMPACPPGVPGCRLVPECSIRPSRCSGLICASLGVRRARFSSVRYATYWGVELRRLSGDPPVLIPWGSGPCIRLARVSTCVAHRGQARRRPSGGPPCGAPERAPRASGGGRAELRGGGVVRKVRGGRHGWRWYEIVMGRRGSVVTGGRGRTVRRSRRQ